MEVSCLSTAYRVRRLKEADVPQILRLCSGNPQFYQYHPPLATADSVRADMRALPPGKMPEDKFYVGYFAGDDLSTGICGHRAIQSCAWAWIGGIHRACPFGAKTALHRYRRESTSSWSGHWSCAERAVCMSD